MMFSWVLTHVGLSVTVAAVLVFLTLLVLFWLSRRGSGYYFFDPQDFALKNSQSQNPRVLPKSAKDATFEPMLRNYLGVVQLLVTVAAASIAFGNNNGVQAVPKAMPIQIGIAKLLLAESLFFGVVFCALLLWRYDEYAQDVTSYTQFWYALISALGFSCLICFVLGYVTWGFGLIL